VKSQDDLSNTCDVISGGSDVMVDPIWEVYERVSGRGCPGNNFIKKISFLAKRHPNWVGSGLALKFKDQTGKGFQGQTL
jgi:hypothetical protein